MKRLFYILSLCVLVSCANNDDDPASDSDSGMEQEDEIVARTAIPDSAFEAFLISRTLDDQLDGFVNTENITGVTELVMDDLGISDLTGLEDFINLDNLWVQNNNLTAINVSNNSRLKFLYIGGNNITSLNVDSLRDLEKLNFENNGIESINVSFNTALQLLEVAGNALATLDVSSNPELFTLDVQNTGLNCVQVSEQQLVDIPNNWQKDDATVYATTCM